MKVLSFYPDTISPRKKHHNPYTTDKIQKDLITFQAQLTKTKFSIISIHTLS